MTTPSDPKLRDMLGASEAEGGSHSAEGVRQHIRKRLDLDRVNAILARVAALPVLDPRTPDEIIGYDEHGLPK